MAADDLLHRVDVRRISADAQQQIPELVRQAVREELARKSDAPTGALRVREAAVYIGLRRTRFLDLLKEDPVLAGLEFKVGRARCWPREGLDQWLRERAAQQQQIEPTPL
jgi:predicted DNA-binding transcriptional regulator AlpA